MKNSPVMKRLTQIFTAMILLIAGGSCRELPLIGDLAGQWQIQQIVYPDGRTVENPQHYYNFYRHTAQLSPGRGVDHTANMAYDNPDLTLQFPTTQPRGLGAWGIVVPDDTPEGTIEWVQKYHIDVLTSERLVMTTEQGVQITCRKY